MVVVFNQDYLGFLMPASTMLAPQDLTPPS